MEISQVRILNKVFIERNEYRELNDSLNSEIKTADKIIATQKLIALSLERQINLHSEIINEKDSIITNYRNLCISKDKNIKSLKVQRIGLVILSAILASIIII